jgi:deoxycytidylate deaminase
MVKMQNLTMYEFCAIDIVDSGIKRFFYKEEYRDVAGVQYLQANGVEVHKL